jgi:hypothetical protein
MDDGSLLRFLRQHQTAPRQSKGAGNTPSPLKTTLNYMDDGSPLRFQIAHQTPQ